MKKKIIIFVFLLLIAITVFVFAKSAIESYHYDMNPANSIDIMVGMGSAMLIVLGGFIVFYEFDLFYTVYYFFIKPKTIAKSVLNLLCNASLLLEIFSEDIAGFLSISEETNVTIALILIYLTLRCVYAFVSLKQED